MAIPEDFFFYMQITFFTGRILLFSSYIEIGGLIGVFLLPSGIVSHSFNSYEFSHTTMFTIYERIYNMR